MDLTAILAGSALAGFALGVGFILWRLRPTRIRSRVAVQLRTGETVLGALWSSTPYFVRLKSCEIIAEGNRAAVDGDVVIGRSNISLIQILTEG